MTISKLVAGAKGAAGNSTGAQIAETVNGLVDRVAPAVSAITVLGSSSAQALNSEMNVWCAERNISYNGMGKGGEWSVHNTARIGAAPFKITFPDNQIPNNQNYINVSCSNFNVDDAFKDRLRTYYGTIAGVVGELSVASGATTLRFRRSSLGSVVDVNADSEFVPILNPSNLLVFWAGKNDINHPTAPDIAAIKQNIDKLHDYAISTQQDFLFIGNFNNSDWALDNPKREAIAEINEYQRAKFGGRYLSIQDWIESYKVWEDTGITPTEADLTAQSNKHLAPSIRKDSAHLSDFVSTFVVNKLISDRLNSLGIVTDTGADDKSRWIINLGGDNRSVIPYVNNVVQPRDLFKQSTVSPIAGSDYLTYNLIYDPSAPLNNSGISATDAGVVTGAALKFSGSILSADIVVNLIYAHSDYFIDHKISRLKPSTNYQLRFIASRTAGSERVTRFTDLSSGIFVEVNTSASPALLVSLNVVSDIHGVVTIRQSHVSGGFSYINAIDVQEI